MFLLLFLLHLINACLFWDSCSYQDHCSYFTFLHTWLSQARVMTGSLHLLMSTSVMQCTWVHALIFWHYSQEWSISSLRLISSTYHKPWVLITLSIDRHFLCWALWTHDIKLKTCALYTNTSGWAASARRKVEGHNAL